MSEKINLTEIAAKTKEAQKTLKKGEGNTFNAQFRLHEVAKMVENGDIEEVAVADLNEYQAKRNELAEQIKQAYVQRKNPEELVTALSDLDYEYYGKPYEYDSKIQNRMNPFMRVVFSKLFNKKKPENINIKMVSIPLTEIDWDSLENIDGKKFGEYSKNPDRSGMRYIDKNEIPKMQILKMKEFVGKPAAEVMKAVIAIAEKEGLRVPDTDDEQYLLSLYEHQIPEILKNGKSYYFTCYLAGQDGAVIPGICWVDGAFIHDAIRTENEWGEDDRIILIEKN